MLYKYNMIGGGVLYTGHEGAKRILKDIQEINEEFNGITDILVNEFKKAIRIRHYKSRVKRR